MSKSLKKKSHWTSKVHESVIGRNPEGQLGFELKGGAENGQFPYLGEVKPGKVAYESGSKLVSEELLLEVNETPVAGLTIRDVLAVIKHCKDPLRLKCVKQEGGGGRVSKEELGEKAFWFRLRIRISQWKIKGKKFSKFSYVEEGPNKAFEIQF
ncbi:hypothetical protein E5288_WYG007857 [Bos mutus]|uniref:PDZ domain-containing protein n=1 Tax=Bos mutus TaxID=72004 RepID=A0A6B0RI62_9CETA|nr:hypothetical protein [Bos mutus]